MDETTPLGLKSLISATGSRIPENASILHSAGVGESLRQSSPSWLRRVGLAVLLLLIPIAYAVLLAMMVSLHGKKQSSFGDTVLEVLSVASTLRPILFAVVLGPLLKSIALFCVERGSALGSLEFLLLKAVLLTSQTTASALKNILTTGWIGSWAICVIAVWSLSPLGGQATLRSLGLQQNPMFTELPATYYLGNNKSEIYQYYRSGASVFIGASAEQSMISDMRTVLSASFSTQDVLVSHANTSSSHYNDIIADLGGKWEASCRGRGDLWRNIRIPFLELLPAYDASDPHTWISVPEDEIVPYASLIGLPIRGGSFERPGNSTMAVHFHYQTLSCGKAFNGSEWVRSGSMAPWSHNTSSSVPLSQQYNGRVEPNMVTLEMYLRDPLGIFQRIFGGYRDDPETADRFACLASLPPEVIERRLATALHTITMSTYEVNVLTGGKGLFLDGGGPVLWQNTTATWTEFDKDIYKLNKPWFITTNVSQDGSGKGGSDRLETIKDAKVRICDVYPEREIGKIALTTELNGPKLRWERSGAMLSFFCLIDLHNVLIL
ncbi:hypothetical protein FOC4_g10000702 [Fusarium odoratissimum]|uniref:Uncharacterized protein n=1 Tax=Fusarium oxysporum f. sp. cubense (strain race 4) TaxID=2502994 RepID=N1S8M1_FUSC4|nr:hypothetical protein FOC4_g10000702 [Fusarium odoratissimum]